MATEVRMAKLSPTMETGTINRWLVKEGAKISSGDQLAEVETDKASMPLETFDEGVLLKIVAGEGKTVKVDELVAVIGKPGEDIAGILAHAAAPAAAAPAAKTAAPAASAPAAKPAPVHAAPAARPAPQPVAVATAEAHYTNGGRLKASPLAKKIAKERGVDLHGVAGSGPAGRIIERDVPLSAPAPAAAAAYGPPGVAVDIPLSNLRQTIARRLLQSKQELPHWYLVAEPNVDKLVALREELNANAEETGVKISVNDLVIKVVAAALRRHPEVNATFQTTKIHRYGDVNIAVAIATEDGLYTPVLRNADRLSLSGISAGVKELAKKTKEKKLRSEDLQGSGFTISNLGMFGVDHFFAIINPPEAAILAVGAVKKKPVVNAAGQVVAGNVMGITLSCDHRVIDGAVAAVFMKTLQTLLENPAKLLL